MSFIQFAWCARVCTVLGICLVAFNVSAQTQAVPPASENAIIQDQSGDDTAKTSAGGASIDDANTDQADKSSDKADSMADIIPRFQPDINSINKQRLMDAFTKENINKYRVSGELVTLNTADTAFLAVWEASRHSTPLGAVLLLHGEGQTLDSPQAIGVIRSSLPDYGWATLSVSIDTPPNKIIPQRIVSVLDVSANSSMSTKDNMSNEADKGDNSKVASSTEEKAEADQAGSDLELVGKASQQGAPDSDAQDETQTAAALQLRMQEQDAAYSQDVLARLQAGLAFLNEKGQFNIAVVAHGTGALYIKQLANQMPASSGDNAGGITTTIRAVVMVNARNVSHLGTQDITALFAQDDFPTLDVFFDTHIADQIEPKQRLKSAKQAKSQDYYQVRLSPPSTHFHEGENRLTRRVRGFLNRFAKGVEIGG